MIFVGVDPGLTGAIAVLDKQSRPIYVHPFKATDGEFCPHKFSDMMNHIRFAHPLEVLPSTRMLVGIEKVHAMPGQGVSSMFKFGNTFGKIQGVLAAKCIPFEFITPQAWTKVMLAGESKCDGKDRSRNVATRLFPELELKESKRSKKAHSGMCDALLIAEFLRRKNLGHA